MRVRIRTENGYLEIVLDKFLTQPKNKVRKLFRLMEKGMTPELTYLYNVGHSKWGVRGMVNVFTAAANNQDVSLEGLQKVTGPLGIYL